MRKAEKRALGEAKAKREAEERRQAGLAAQKSGHQRGSFRVGYTEEGNRASTRKTEEEMRLARNGYTNTEIAGLLDEQPPLGGIDDIKIEDFMTMSQVFHAKAEERMRRAMTNPDRAREFAKALAIGGFFQTAAESLERMSQGSAKAVEAMQAYSDADIAMTEKRYGVSSQDRADASARFDRFIGEMEEIKTTLKKKSDL